MKILLYLCTVNHVKSNILNTKKTRLNLVADWFQPRSHNHDYVQKIVRSNKIKVTKIMPKEETLYLFRTSDVRLQLVCMHTMPEFSYQIRQNRIVKLTTHDLNMARARFESIVFYITRQTNLF